MKLFQKHIKAAVLLAVSSVTLAVLPAIAEEQSAEPVAEVSEASHKTALDTLPHVLARALDSNPEFAAVRANFLATLEQMRQAKARYLPSVDVSADTGFEHSDDQSTRASGGTEQLGRYEAGLTFTQLLFDGGETKYENMRQEARSQSARYRVQEAGELIGLAIVDAYLSVLQQKELLEIADQNIKDHQDFFKQIEDSANAGRSSMANVAQARARVASAQAQRAQAEQNLRFAEASFIRQVGAAPQNLQRPAIPRERVEAELDTLIEYALENSPTLKIRHADIAASDAETEGAYAQFYPQFDFQVNAREGKDLGGVRGRDTSATALVTMDWNLYRGGGDVARLAETKRRAQQIKEQKEDTARQLRNDIHEAWAQYKAAGQRAAMFEAQMQANKELVKAYHDQFELGRRTLLDLLDTQNEFFASQSNFVNARFLEIFSAYRLLALKGDLLEALSLHQLIDDKLETEKRRFTNFKQVLQE